MNVTLLTTSYPMRTNPISGVFVARLVAYLAKSMTVTVLTPADVDMARRTQSGGVIILPCRYAPQRWQRLAHSPGGIPVALKMNRWNYLLLPGLLISLFINCLRVARADSIYQANWAICGCIAGIAGRLMDVPVITTLRGEDVTRAKVSVLARLLLRLCFRLSRYVVTVSSDMRSWLVEQFPEYRGKLVLIENGVDEDFFSLPAVRTIDDTADRRVVKLVTVGSLIPRKGVDQILYAIKQIGDPRIEFTIIGAGPEERALRDIAAVAGLSDKVRFTGIVAAADIPRQLATADIFVLASHSEGRPNAILEAMAAGLPIIATDIAGVGELVQPEQTGLLFADCSIGQLAQCIRRLVADAGLRRRYGEAGRQAILSRGLTWPNCAGKYIELYRLSLNVQ